MKYGNKIVEVDGIRFHSQKEARRYKVLKLMEKGGAASELRMQVKYPIIVNGMKVCQYVADFVYVRDGVTVVEDVKGYRTPEYRLKKKLMMAVYGIEIFET